MSDPRFAFKRPESVLVVVYTTAGEALLIKRVRPVFWQSVTGGLKWPDETPGAAALRELAEETSISADPARLRDWEHTESFEILPAWRVRYGPDAVLNVEHQFSVELSERQPVILNPNEHTEYRWVDIDQAINEAWSWTNKAALERIRDDL